MNGRLRAYTVTFILVCLVASPLVGAFAGDSFPISTYPMFASVKLSEAQLSHVILVDANGEEWAAPPSAIANDEALQAQETLRQALNNGEAATETLCERVARRMAGSGAIYAQVITSTYDALLYYQDNHKPIERTVHATCEVQP